MSPAARRVLVVDDETGITTALRRVLGREGYEVTVCNEPREALARLQPETFDAIISDQRMPGMTGTELMKLVYCLINIAMIGLSLFLNRRIYSVFGAIGVATYLGYLASEVFKDVILFSFALSAIGLAVIGLGLLLHRNRARMLESMDTLVPQSLVWLRPEHARTATQR